MAHFSPSLAGGSIGAPARATWSRSAGPALLAVGCCAALLVPSARTGGATRSGYGFVRAAQAAGILHGPWAHVLGWSLLAVPVLAGSSGAAAVLRAGKASAVFCGLAGLVTLAFSAWLSVKLPGSFPLGPWAGAVLGTGAVATAFRYVTQGSVPHAQ
ncbi:MAG: hypothetical protein ACLQVK_00295 [Acidimicrobiales bacterium]